MGSLEGWLFNITAMPQAILVTATHPSQAGSRWIVEPHARSKDARPRRRRY
jgi:hypothetical protein